MTEQFTSAYNEWRRVRGELKELQKNLTNRFGRGFSVDISRI